MQYPVSMHLYCVSITYEAVEGYMKSPLEAFNVPAGQSVKWVNYLSPGKMVLPIADEKKISQIDLTRNVKMYYNFGIPHPPPPPLTFFNDNKRCDVLSLSESAEARSPVL